MSRRGIDQAQVAIATGMHWNLLPRTMVRFGQQDALSYLLYLAAGLAWLAAAYCSSVTGSSQMVPSPSSVPSSMAMWLIVAPAPCQCGAGHRVLATRCDVADEDQVADAIAKTVQTFGRLDLAYNNAGIQSPMTDAADETADVFDRVNAVNLRGIWASMKHELAQMRVQGSGAIVNCSSLGGLVGLPGRAAYHASKHGVIGLTRSAALEYAPRGIRINAICPGTIETPMVTQMIGSGDLDRAEAAANQPIGRLGSAEEMAAAVLWLCSPGASFVVGVALPVDGGYTAR